MRRLLLPLLGAAILTSVLGYGTPAAQARGVRGDDGGGAAALLTAPAPSLDRRIAPSQQGGCRPATGAELILIGLAGAGQVDPARSYTLCWGLTEDGRVFKYWY